MMAALEEGGPRREQLTALLREVGPGSRDATRRERSSPGRGGAAAARSPQVSTSAAGPQRNPPKPPTKPNQTKPKRNETQRLSEPEFGETLVSMMVLGHTRLDQVEAAKGQRGGGGGGGMMSALMSMGFEELLWHTLSHLLAK